MRLSYLKRLAPLALLVMSSTVGCVAYTSDQPFPSNHTEIVLQEDDFKAVESNMRSSAECWYLFGVIPLGDPNIRSSCMSDIRSQAKLASRSAQLVNMTQDESKLMVFIFATRHQLTLSADAIEYTR